MLKKVTRLISLILSVAFVISTIGCSKDTNQNNGQSSTSTSTSTSTQTAAPKEIPTVKVVTTWDPGVNISSDSLIFQEWGERTGVKFDVTVNPRDSHKDKVNILLASNEIPDLLKFFQDADSYNIYGAKLFAPLDDYLDSGKLPNLQKYLKKYPEIEQKMRNLQDKKLYGFGIVQDFDFFAPLWYVRNDALKKQGMDASQINTLDDFKEACLALRTAKGKDYITSTRLGWDYYSGFASVYFGVSAITGVTYDAARKDGTKKYVFSPVDLKEQFKQWVEFEKWMFDNKLLDPNFLTMKDQELFTGYADGSYPLMREQFTMPYSAVANMNPMNDPGIDIQPIYPFDINGQKYSFAKMPHYNIAYRSPWVISNKSKAIPDLMTALDYTYSDEGINLCFVGIEGTTYTIDTKTPSGFRLDKVQSVWTIGADGKFPDGMKTLKDYGFDSWWVTGVIPAYNRFALLNYKEGEDAAANVNMITAETMNKNGYLRNPDPDLTWTTEENARKVELENAIKTYLSENVLKFILGAKPISEYDSFISGFDKFKYKDLIDMYNKKLLK